jgi:hypothetical protein
MGEETGPYWTLGAFDGMIVCETPDEEKARAYDAAQMRIILGLLPK